MKVVMIMVVGRQVGQRGLPQETLVGWQKVGGLQRRPCGARHCNS